jgi:hypothetical protein
MTLPIFLELRKVLATFFCHAPFMNFIFVVFHSAPHLLGNALGECSKTHQSIRLTCKGFKCLKVWIISTRFENSAIEDKRCSGSSIEHDHDKVLLSGEPAANSIGLSRELGVTRCHGGGWPFLPILPMRSGSFQSEWLGTLTCCQLKSFAMLMSHTPAQIFLAGKHPVEYFTCTTSFRRVIEPMDEDSHPIQ